MNELFGSKYLLDPQDLGKLFARLAVDLVFAFLIIRVVYFRLYRNREYIFTLFMFNIITFSMCFLLRKVPIELGFALGLFAVFGILRYRTEPIRIRDLTYLFIVIGLGILNALSNKKISVSELVAVNAIIAGATMILELGQAKNRSHSTPILYDNLELLKPGRHQDMLDDLRERTGLHVIRVEVNRIDMLRDAAELTIFYDRADGA
ncbi:MAG TPA: DUF4956 domain-containing protein [Kofleriaceae bacterium]|nr:DUF4956 domain-containing protein [Kofleriaceae bacterium]